MFYETVGPGWHRSYKPSQHEDMSWSPSNRNFRSPPSSPESYRRIIRTEEDFPTGRQKELDDKFFGGRKSPTFPRRIFKEVWNDAPSTNHRFSERPRMFKRVFKPSQWEEEFDKEDIPHLRRFEREFDKFDNNRPSSRKFDEDFDRHFNARDLQKDMKDEFGKSEGKVHHIPIMVERRMEEMKSRFGGRNSPPSESSHEDEYGEDWTGPQVQRLKKTFEPEDDFPKGYHGVPRFDSHLKSRVFSHSIPDTWDPHTVHTLPTRKLHKASQSMDDSKHPAPPKSVFRSYSETHEDIPKPPQQHSAAFRSHSDGHCPHQTYITKIEVPVKQDAGSCSGSSRDLDHSASGDKQQNFTKQRNHEENSADTYEQKNVKFKPKGKCDSPSLQQIAVVMQNVDDLITRIEGYSGNGRDKQYRFLDEMLTRCMIRLDGIDTEGREDIRNARKAAIRDVQICIDRLEAKADESERQHAAKLSLAKTTDDTKRAIPLGDGSDMAIPLSDGSEKTKTPADTSVEPIPLGDGPKHAIPLGEGPRMAIPLGDVPRPAIPLPDRSTTPIPLGDVPRLTEKKIGQNNMTEEKSYSRQNSGNGNVEQTKL